MNEHGKPEPKRESQDTMPPTTPGTPDDRDLVWVDPDNVVLSETNERSEYSGLHLEGDELMENVAKRGVYQPVVIRRRRDVRPGDIEYECIIGQRRIDAAARAGQQVPAVLVEWDDAESLLASISENYEGFREEVSRENRARAMKRVKDETGWDNARLAEELGVSTNMVSKYLERTHSAWDNTSVSVVDATKTTTTTTTTETTEVTMTGPETATDTATEADADTATETEAEVGGVEVEVLAPGEEPMDTDAFDPDAIPDGSLQIIRRITEGGETGEWLARKVAAETNRKGDGVMSLHDVEELQQVARRLNKGDLPTTDRSLLSKAFETVKARIAREMAGDEEPDVKVSVRIRFEGRVAEALEKAAEANGWSDEGVVQHYVEAGLRADGYLKER